MQKFPETPQFLQQVHSSALRESKIIPANSKNPHKRGWELWFLINVQGEALSLCLTPELKVKQQSQVKTEIS